MQPPLHRLVRALFLASVAASAACDPVASSSAGARQERASAGSLHLAATLVTGADRVEVAVGPGAGPAFEPLRAQLSPASSAAWTGFVYGIPAGPGRDIDVSAFNAAGLLTFHGGARFDVVSGATTSVVVAMLVTSQAAGPDHSAAIIDSVTLSPATVAPGASAALTASVTPGDEPVTFAWSGTCGTFSAADGATTRWTAPATADVRCQLSFTAGSAHSSSTVDLSVAVREDPSARDVSGRRMASCWPDLLAGSSGFVAPSAVAPDVALLAAPAALVQTAPGTWTTYPGGHLRPDGSFEQGRFDPGGAFLIPGVPGSSRYLFSFTGPSGVRLLVDTDAPSIDLGYDQLGRCSPQPAVAGTVLALHLSGLLPWSAQTSALEITSSAADLWSRIPAKGVLANGTTFGTTDLLLDGFALPAADDVFWVHELSTARHPDGLLYYSAVRAGALAGIAPPGGATSDFDLPLSYAHQAGQLPLDWSPPEFEAQLPLLAPPARVTAGVVPPHRLVVSASPFRLLAPAPAPPGGTPNLAIVDLPAGAPRLALSSPLRYGQFLPAQWREWREVRFATAAGYQAPGATETIYDVASVGRRDELPATPGQLGPALTPVQALQLNGASALLDQTVPVTTTPTFSWSPPATGSPTHYQLEVFRLAAPAGATASTAVLRFLTAATSASVPPGILVPGETYYAKLTALSSLAPFDSAPLRYTPLYAYAATLSGTFAP